MSSALLKNGAQSEAGLQGCLPEGIRTRKREWGGRLNRVAPGNVGRVHADIQAPLHQSGLWRCDHTTPTLLPTGSTARAGRTACTTRHVPLTGSQFKTSLILAKKWEKAKARVDEEAGGGDTDPGCLFHPGDDWV